MKTNYLNERQVAKMLNCGLSTLRNRRFLGKGPPYIKFGRCVRYSESDLYDYMEMHKIKTREEITKEVFK